jgi:hypothetical protein
MAIVSRAVASVRSCPNPRAELLTQEILGHEVAVMTIRRDWARCRLRDGYLGWMPLGALCLSRDYRPSHLVIRRFARIRMGRTGDVIVPLGSRLRASGEAGRGLAVVLPGGSRGSVSKDSVRRLNQVRWGKRRFEEVVREVVGTPYLWGGKSTFGFDCSGLVQFAYEFLGLRLPRDSGEQAGKGRLVGLSRLRPFDLLFFGAQDRIDHVAIHLGRWSILHASGHVKVESLDPLSPQFRGDLLKRLRCARRVAHV